ncbi:MAG: dipicolinic acid synthetase subunit A, partial [Candidatus Saccharibacteria bacterium]
AYEIGCRRVRLEDMGDNLAGLDVIFNTAPTMVLNDQVLSRMSPDTLIIDLASQPGGTDFENANRYGIKAILAPGLPGKVAPKMAGRILAEVIPRLILEELSRESNKLLEA